MAVYVDPIFTWPVELTKEGQARRVAQRNNGRWCHMLADSVEELVAFAESIGLRKQWLQENRPGGMPHFDLTPGKRAVALRRGAKEISGREQYELMQRVRISLAPNP